jgi:hypothetical protein
MTSKTFLVTVELDGTGSGTFGTALSAKQVLQGILTDRLPEAYNPVVEFAPAEPTPVHELGLPKGAEVDPAALVMPTVEAAWEVLSSLARIIVQDGNASIADLHALVYFKPTRPAHYSDHYYGWVAGNAVSVKTTNEGHFLVLPDPIRLTEEKGK